MDYFGDQLIIVGSRTRGSPDLEASWMQVAIAAFEREDNGILSEFLPQQKRDSGVVNSGPRRSVGFPDNLVVQTALHFYQRTYAYKWVSRLLFIQRGVQLIQIFTRATLC